MSPAWLWDSASSRGRLNEKSYGVGPTHHNQILMGPTPPPSIPGGRVIAPPPNANANVNVSHAVHTQPQPAALAAVRGESRDDDGGPPCQLCTTTAAVAQLARADAHRRADAARAELTALRARVVELEGSLMDSGAEVERLQRDLTAKGTRLEEAAMRAHKAEQLAVDLEAGCRRSERAAAESAASAAEVHRREQEAEVQATAAKARAAEASTQLQQALARAATAEREIEGCRAAALAAAATATRVEASNREAAAEAAEARRAQAAAAEQTTAAAVARAAAAEVRAADTSTLLEAADARVAEVLNRLEAAEAQAEAASTMLTAAEARVAEASTQLEAMAARAAAAESEIEGCRAAVAASAAEAAGQHDAANAAVAAAESTVAAEAERAAAAEALAAVMQRRCEALERAAEEASAAAASAAALGPLASARAYFDPALPAADAAAARAALVAAGGSECAGWHGGGGCTLVVADPAAALPYLIKARPAGVGAGAGAGGTIHPGVQDLFVVTPQWLARTAERGQRARCCVLSPDAAAAVASRAVSSGGAGGSGGGGTTERGTEAFNEGEVPRQLGMKRGVEALEEPCKVCDQAGGSDARTSAAAAAAAAVAGAEVDRRRKAGRSHRSGTWPKSLAPKSLLEGVCWAVTDAPETARWYREGACGFGKSGAIGSVDGSGASSGGGDDNANFRSASQDNGGGGDSETVPLGTAARDAVVYTLPFITLLLPADRFQEVGLRSLTHRVHERGLTVGELLRVVHDYYAAPLEPWEEGELMLCDSKYASRLRASHAAGERTPRGAVLGSLRTVECLRRCSGGSSAAYEVVLIPG